MTACIEVLERQYRKSFNTESILTSVRNHTREIESVIGEYFEKKRISQNAYVSSISNIIKVKQNNVWKFLNELDTDFQNYTNLAMKYGIVISLHCKSSKVTVNAEILRRIKERKRQNEKQKKTQLQKRLNKISQTSSAIKAGFQDLDLQCVDVENLYKILTGDLVGHRITYVWNVNSVDKLFVGWVNGFCDPYYIFYKDENKDYGLSKFDMATDYLIRELDISYNYLLSSTWVGQ